MSAFKKNTGGREENRVSNAFIPSSYTGNVSCTTTVAGQSVAIATAVSKLRVRNIGATNYAFIAFGASAAEAEANAASGLLVEADTTEVIGVPEQATHFAYVADTGTVTLNIQQGA